MVHVTLEESLAETCPNCGQNHNAKFFSLFVAEMHYVIGDCENCGYRIEIPKHELGSGLFLPDGEVIVDTFKKKHTEHMRERLRKSEETSCVTPSLGIHRVRFLDNEPINEQRER